MGSCVQLDDQGLVQADPRNIAVPDGFVNMIPTDIRGLTFSRTPQMVCSLHPCAIPCPCPSNVIWFDVNCPTYEEGVPITEWYASGRVEHI